jgi:protein tyrosine phosphatase type 4A
MSSATSPGSPISTFLERGRLRFLMVDCPTDATLDAYIAEMRRYGVTDLARANEGCDKNYSSERLAKAGIAPHDVPFTDGDSPPPAVVSKWLGILEEVFADGNPKRRAVGVHCLAGLGRTAVLVAIALIEDGMDPMDAVTFIRARRRGAINAKQLVYLQGYKRRGKGGGCCAVV